MRALPLLLLLGCTDPLPPPGHTQSSALTAPWDVMGLPVAGGVPRRSDADTVTFEHPSGDPEALADAYVAALAGHGVTAGRRVAGQVAVQQDLTTGDRSLSLAIRRDGDHLVASLAWVPE